MRALPLTTLIHSLTTLTSSSSKLTKARGTCLLLPTANRPAPHPTDILLPQLSAILQLQTLPTLRLTALRVQTRCRLPTRCLSPPLRAFARFITKTCCWSRTTRCRWSRATRTGRSSRTSRAGWTSRASRACCYYTALCFLIRILSGVICPYQLSTQRSSVSHHLFPFQRIGRTVPSWYRHIRFPPPTCTH